LQMTAAASHRSLQVGVCKCVGVGIGVVVGVFVWVCGEGGSVLRGSALTPSAYHQQMNILTYNCKRIHTRMHTHTLT